MNSTFNKAVFISFKNGYYTFTFDNGTDMVFEEIHPKILLKYDLKNDETLRNKLFHLSFSEQVTDDEDDLVIYRIEFLEIINNN